MGDIKEFQAEDQGACDFVYVSLAVAAATLCVLRLYFPVARRFAVPYHLTTDLPSLLAAHFFPCPLRNAIHVAARGARQERNGRDPVAALRLLLVSRARTAGLPARGEVVPYRARFPESPGERVALDDVSEMALAGGYVRVCVQATQTTAGIEETHTEWQSRAKSFA